jgi:hypothetical protein
MDSLYRLDEYERDILRYVLCWAPYGGPPVDDIMPRFGISSRELRPRIRDIAFCALVGRLEPEDHSLILQVLELLRRRRHSLHE